MIFSFVLGVIAGYLQPVAERHVKKAVEDVFDVQFRDQQRQSDLLTMLLLLVLAVLILAILGSVWVLPLLIGALVGVFGPQLFEAATTKTIGSGTRRD